MDKTRVTRSLQPGAAGTQRLLLQYGSGLVCVRYRTSADGLTRFTTAEIVIDRRASPDSLVRVVTADHETRLHASLREAGARWDGSQRCWITSLRTVRRLRLSARIIGPVQPPPRRQTPSSL